LGVTSRWTPTFGAFGEPVLLGILAFRTDAADGSTPQYLPLLVEAVSTVYKELWRALSRSPFAQAGHAYLTEYRL